MTNDLAIKILNGEILGTSEQTHEAVAMAVKALSALPSAQPDVTDIIVGDTISRRAAIRSVCEKECRVLKPCNAECGSVIALRELPSIEAEPVRQGQWVYGEDEDGVDGYRCNKCGFFVTWDYKHSHIHFIDDYLFCPHCNARMDEVT